MLEKIENLGKILNRTELKSINGGLNEGTNSNLRDCWYYNINCIPPGN